jgi:hypothetical protein
LDGDSTRRVGKKTAENYPAVRDFRAKVTPFGDDVQKAIELATKAPAWPDISGMAASVEPPPRPDLCRIVDHCGRVGWGALVVTQTARPRIGAFAGREVDLYVFRRWRCTDSQAAPLAAVPLSHVLSGIEAPKPVVNVERPLKPHPLQAGLDAINAAAAHLGEKERMRRIRRFYREQRQKSKKR